MKAVVVTPGKAGSVRLIDAPQPRPGSSDALLRVRRIGIDGTDLEINQGLYGEVPPGADYLICGHECLATVESAPPQASGIQNGDLVVPTVRRPDNCLNCRAGESDMCSMGGYKEHGIKALHGFCSELTITDVNFLVKIPKKLSDVAVLLEPMSVAEKAVLQTLKIQGRMVWKPRTALVLGTGPLGLLTVLLLRVKGFDVTAVARRPRESVKAQIVQKAGGNYVNSSEQPVKSLGKFDFILEETGAATLAAQAQELLNPNGVLCLLGIYSSTELAQDIGRVYADIVLGNKIVFGSVNANIRYFRQGLEDFATIQLRYPGVLQSLFTKIVPPSGFSQAYNPSLDDIKFLIDFQSLS